MRRVLVQGLLMTLLASGCSSVPTSIVLHVVAGEDLSTPALLRLWVFDDRDGRVVSDRSLPPSGAPLLPAVAVLYPGSSSSRVRLLIRAFSTSASVIGEGVATVKPRPNAQVEATLRIHRGKSPDRDGDGVPDSIDNCPDKVNELQERCEDVPDGRVDADGPADDSSRPDVRLPDQAAPDLPTECRENKDCDDRNVCTAEYCAGRKCVRRKLSGRSCSDNNVCTPFDRCQAGRCVGSGVKSCTAQTNRCQVASCDSALGCVVKNKPDNTSCSDGKYCTVSDVCKNGICQGSPRNCGIAAGCSIRTCNEIRGRCEAKTQADGFPCDDGQRCTQNESCQAGVCKAPAIYKDLVAKGDVTGMTSRSTVVDGKGKVHTVYYTTSSPGGIYWATNESGSWSSALLDGTITDRPFTVLLIDKTDTLHLFFLDALGDGLRYRKKPASGAWSVETTLATPANHGVGAAFDPNGKTIHVAFGRGRDLYYTSGSGTTWSVPIKLDSPPATAKASEIVGRGSVAVDAQGKVHISHGLNDMAATLLTSRELFYTSNVSGAWKTERAAPSLSIDHGELSSIAVAKSGTVLISYYSQVSKKLYLSQKVAGGSWSLTALDGGGVGSFSSIVLDSKDQYHIAYRNYSGGELRYITNAQGAPTPMILDTTGNAGRWLSLFRERSGRMHITFERQARKELRYTSFSACP